MGTPGTEDGQAYGLHGVISNTPAEHVSYGVYCIRQNQHIQSLAIANPERVGAF